MLKPRVIYLAPLFIIIVVILLAACSGAGGAPRNTGLIKAKWVEPQVSGDTASLALDEVKASGMTHFALGTASGDMAFMAYELENSLYVRANICPPCRSQGFSLKEDRLICDTCGTVFDARDGGGIEGACVAYPKAPVAYEMREGKIVMQANSLMSAYLDTLKPGS